MSAFFTHLNKPVPAINVNGKRAREPEAEQEVLSDSEIECLGELDFSGDEQEMDYEVPPSEAEEERKTPPPSPSSVAETQMEQEPPVAPVAPGGGNTINPPRRSAAKRWTFTLFTDELNVDNFQSYLAPLAPISSGFVAGLETCSSTDRLHIQGYVEFKKKTRPFEATSIAWRRRAHWEVAKGTREQNVSYCSKEGNAVYGGAIKAPRQPVQTLATESLYGWQEEVWRYVQQPAHPRTVLWIWEPEGGVGKSALCKKICVELEGSIMMAGKAADMKYGIACMMEKDAAWEPKIVIFDVPRSMKEYVSYSGMEEVKNGCFFSSKYEGRMCMYNAPHVLVFSNSMPDLDKMSADRWRVLKIDGYSRGFEQHQEGLGVDE